MRDSRKHSEVSREDVENYLKSNTFSEYQSVPLPFNLRTPGKDSQKRIDKILGPEISGKSVLDIGTFYGMFPAEAINRGAISAVGLEPDPERYSVARKLAELNGDRYEILNGKLGETTIEGTFDVVLLLNVLHHFLNPITAIERAASYSRDVLIVEFCNALDPAYMTYCYSSAGKRSFATDAWATIQSLLVSIASHKLPLMAVGNKEYHRIFYFSERAFYNIFVVHLKLFDEIEFERSAFSRNRVVGRCKVSRHR